MNPTHRISLAVYCLGAAWLAPSANAASIILNFDASFEGLATSEQQPMTIGMVKLGWFEPITDTAIQDQFTVGDIASLEEHFHPVASVGDLNSFGPGLPFDSITIWEASDAGSLETYRKTIAGKQIYAWFLSDERGSATISLEQAIVKSDILFPQALDELTFSDFSETFGTDSYSPGITAVIGSISTVGMGSGVDLNDGSPADGLGLQGGDKVLQMSHVEFVPEPSGILLLPLGTLVWVFGGRKRPKSPVQGISPIGDKT